MIEPQSAPWWLAGGAAALWVAREFVGAVLSRKKNRSETEANIELIDQLRNGMDRMNARLLAMEEIQDRLSHRLEEEIHARQAAQEEAHRLKLRVQTLESELRRLGVVIPEEVA